MKIKVVKTFWDKNDTRVCYNVGEVHSFDDERAHSLIERGFGVAFEDPKTEEPAHTEAPAPKDESPVVEHADEMPTNEGEGVAENATTNAEVENAESAEVENAEAENAEVAEPVENAEEAPATKRGRGRSPKGE